jgi:hypothetical protein
MEREDDMVVRFSSVGGKRRIVVPGSCSDGVRINEVPVLSYFGTNARPKGRATWLLTHLLVG